MPSLTVAVPSASQDVAVDLVAVDPDGDPIKFTITTLPGVGMLLFPASKAAGAALTAVTSHMELPAGVDSVVYRPAAAASPSPVTFGYTARDSNGASPIEGAYDAFVTFKLPENVTTAAAASSTSMPLMAGPAGYALVLDGTATLTAAAMTASNTGSFALEAWVKASGGQPHHSATIVSLPGFKLLASRLAGLSLVYTSTTADGNVFTLQAGGLLRTSTRQTLNLLLLLRALSYMNEHSPQGQVMWARPISVWWLSWMTLPPGGARARPGASRRHLALRGGRET